MRGAGSERDSLWPVSYSIHGTPFTCFLTPVPCTVNRPRPVSKHSGLDFFWASFLLGFGEKASLWHVSPNSTQGAWFTCFLTAFPWPPAQKGGPGQGLLWHVSSNSAQETFLTCFLTAVSRLPAKGRPRFQNTLALWFRSGFFLGVFLGGFCGKGLSLACFMFPPTAPKEVFSLAF